MMDEYVALKGTNIEQEVGYAKRRDRRDQSGERTDMPTSFNRTTTPTTHPRLRALQTGLGTVRASSWAGPERAHER
jgi:hypothetical protein